jgi:hypothetical protein
MAIKVKDARKEERELKIKINSCPKYIIELAAKDKITVDIRPLGIIVVIPTQFTRYGQACEALNALSKILSENPVKEVVFTEAEYYDCGDFEDTFWGSK